MPLTLKIKASYFSETSVTTSRQDQKSRVVGFVFLNLQPHRKDSAPSDHSVNSREITQKINLFLVSVQDGSCSFDIAESERDNQTAPSPTIVKEKAFKSKTTCVIRSTILVFNYSIQCQIMNIVYMQYPKYTKNSPLNTT